MNTYATVVLAAGNGTRMRSTLPKVLHPLAGEPLLVHVLNAIEAIPSTETFAHYAPFTSAQDPIVVRGQAPLPAEPMVGGLVAFDQPVLAGYGDAAFNGGAIVVHVFAEHLRRQVAVAVLRGHVDGPSDYGRLVRDAEGGVQESVEV